MRARLCSGNPHKLEELRAALPGWELDLVDPGDPPDEVGDTYLENARVKAAAGRLADPSADWILGEDSGIEVAGLAGGPGVLSARYAGPGEDQVEKLLSALEDVEGHGRTARYVCQLLALAPDGEEVRATGVLAGSVAREPRGSEGFGYDPIFVPEGEERTVAELGNAWKREHSHRALAARALRAAIEGR